MQHDAITRNSFVLVWESLRHLWRHDDDRSIRIFKSWICSFFMSFILLSSFFFLLSFHSFSLVQVKPSVDTHRPRKHAVYKFIAVVLVWHVKRLMIYLWINLLDRWHIPKKGKRYHVKMKAKYVILSYQECVSVSPIGWAQCFPRMPWNITVHPCKRSWKFSILIYQTARCQIWTQS